MPEQNPPTLGCGKCGYPVRGLSELTCPECGADLTEVGIIRGGDARAGLASILVPLGYTVNVAAIAIIVYVLLGFVLPTYSDRYYSIQVEPISGQYEELGIHINADLIEPAPAASTSMSVSPGSGPMTTVTMCAPGTRVTVTDVDIFFKPNGPDGRPGNQSFAIGFDLDTGQASWVDADLNGHSSPGAFTDQDLLACFASHGIDTTRADVQTEAKQVYDFIAGFTQGQHQLTLSAFNSRAYGGANNLSTGPPLFQPSYIAAWFVIWLIGLVLIIRRARKRASA